MSEYKQKRIVDSKPRYVILDGEGLVIDKNPSKERLNQVLIWNFKHNETGICPRCREENTVTEKSILDGNACKERDKYGKKTGRFVCENHWKKDYEKYNPDSSRNARKSVANCRTDNENQDHSSTKGNEDIELACKLYGYIDLNKKYNNHITPVDCQDPITGLLYQIRGKTLGIISRYTTVSGKEKYYEGWDFTDLGDEWYKDYEAMIFICRSKDRKIIEEIYKIPFKNIKEKIKRIGIYKNVSKWIPWYGKFRIKDEEEIRKANDILQRILEEEN